MQSHSHQLPLRRCGPCECSSTRVVCRNDIPRTANTYAMQIGSNLHTCFYRSGYDISAPLPPKALFSAFADTSPTDRKYFLTVKVRMYCILSCLQFPRKTLRFFRRFDAYLPACSFKGIRVHARASVVAWFDGNCCGGHCWQLVSVSGPQPCTALWYSVSFASTQSAGTAVWSASKGDNIVRLHVAFDPPNSTNV